jgi:opacity protein-like surface antigen
MKTLGGAARGRKGYLALLIALLTVCLLLPGPVPAAAEVNSAFYVAVGAAALLGSAAIGYSIYELNRPGPRLLDGEFYGGPYLGASFAPSQDLNYNNGAVFNNGANIIYTQKFKVSNNQFDTGVVGGIKLGYFFKSVPNLGLEGESNFGPNNVSKQSRSVSPAILGSPQVRMPSTSWLNWTTALHIVGRVGCLKDNEVPFGRLQPYVGIGPAVVAMYDPNDSAKNFAIDAMAGIRYMLTKNLSAFVEYKYNHQFSPEIEVHQVQVNNYVGLGTATLSYDLHRVVFGMTFHW